MQNNAPPPVTAQMAELGAAIVASVQAILDNPKQAAAAVKERALAVALTEKEMQEAGEARDTLARLAREKQSLQEWQDTLTQAEQELREGAEKLTQRESAHSSNVTGLNRAQAAHDTRLKQTETRESRLEEGEEDLRDGQLQLQKDQEALKVREAKVKEREDELKRLAGKLGGAAA